MGSCLSQPRELPTPTNMSVEELNSKVVELSKQAEGLIEELARVTKRANFHEEEAGRALKQFNEAVDDKLQAQGEVKVLEKALSESQ